MRRLLPLLSVCLFVAGCSALPDIAHQPQYHNPFPQLTRVAILPFFNQSAEPTVDGDAVALAYYNELQAIRGFEVVPVGVTKLRLINGGLDLSSATDFQELAQLMDVDVVVVGSITEYSVYYPPRMGLSVRWYAANPSFHPIPPGYGLPWGTPAEEYIPEDLVFEAEFALAKEQLKTQTPPHGPQRATSVDDSEVKHAAAEQLATEQSEESSAEIFSAGASVLVDSQAQLPSDASRLPPDWPDPRGLIPPPPALERPPVCVQREPIITHTRLYHGQDAEFTKRLASYYYFRDDARFGGWQGYLERSEDFVRFCCHLHIAEMLTARGGAGETRVVWRWPIRRYER
jgi:hypothetical protein